MTVSISTVTRLLQLAVLQVFRTVTRTVMGTAPRLAFSIRQGSRQLPYTYTVPSIVMATVAGCTMGSII